MRPRAFAVPVAVGLALGGASLATGADDPPKPSKPVRVIAERPAPVEAPPLMMHGGPLLPAAEPFGLHKEIADDMAKELGLPAERVAEAMRKAIGAQFDRRRDEALDCFDDREKCKAAGTLAGGNARAVPVRPGRTVKP